MIGDFHFLRPWWLLALVPAGLLAWRMAAVRREADAWRGIIAPHLMNHLLIRPDRSRTIGPAAWLLLAWMLSAISVAGPTWRREPTPFAEDLAAIVIVLKVTPSMRTADIAPDRLTRSTQKIHDLLAARPGVKSAMIAYSGSVHVASPLTSDPGIINSFAEAMDPAIMPVEGDAAAEALEKARRLLLEGKTAGTILWIADSVSPEAQRSLSADKHDGVQVLAVTRAGTEQDSLLTAAKVIGARVTRLTPDDADIRTLSRDTRFATIASPDGGNRWHEFGYAIVPVAALLMLPVFRRWVLGSVGGRGQ